MLDLLRMKGAHADFDSTVDAFPVDLRGKKIPGAPHTAWQLLEHLRIAQEDILDYSRNSDYQNKKWPDDYWPKSAAPPGDAAWDQSIARFRKDLKAIERLISGAGVDLMAPLPHAKGHTLLRQALLVADHNSYHLGQLMFLRKTLEEKQRLTKKTV